MASSPGSSLPFTPETGVHPANTQITVRDMRFCRNSQPHRWWLAGDPVATAWFTALSGTFPRGEAFFIEAVKANRDGVPPQLAEDIRTFVVQEVNHSREHLALNRIAADAGYDMAMIDRRVEEMMALTKGRPVIIDLAATMALEHFTAMMANEFLSNPRHMAGADQEIAALWRWHAIEEIEHKAVAFDTYLHATRDWSRFKRWRLRSVMMALITWHFLAHRWRDVIDLLKPDGVTGLRARTRLAWFLIGKPGVLRRIFPAWLAYFKPGFHPWDVDDRALIRQAARDLEARA